MSKKFIGRKEELKALSDLKSQAKPLNCLPAKLRINQLWSY